MGWGVTSIIVAAAMLAAGGAAAQSVVMPPLPPPPAVLQTADAARMQDAGAIAARLAVTPEEAARQLRLQEASVPATEDIARRYAERLAGEARAFRHPRSPLERAINRLLFWLVGLMLVLGAILGYALWRRDATVSDAVSTSTAAVLSMVPEGLVLLMSLTYAVSSLRMARRGALAQQLLGPHSRELLGDGDIDQLVQRDPLVLGDAARLVQQRGKQAQGDVAAAHLSSPRA